MGEQHISSLVVLHRPDSASVVREFMTTHQALQIAAEGDCRCVLLCETDNQRAIVDHIDALSLLPGVINVSLVYHHVEPADELDKPAMTMESKQGADA
jgi:nitrate reductase NapD